MLYAQMCTVVILLYSAYEKHTYKLGLEGRGRIFEQQKRLYSYYLPLKFLHQLSLVQSI